MSEEKKILATVVTFNRKELLKECIEALKKSDYPCDVLVVDNASTDGTQEYVDSLIDNEKVKYINTGKNLGGAGGFNFAFKEAMKYDYDYIWVMDDDTIVHNDSLSELIKAGDKLDNKFGFLCSYAEFTDGTPCLMNIPELEKHEWYKGLSQKVLKVNRATFVSMLIPTEIVKKKGLPIKEFFIWADDTEYSKRILSDYPSYYVVDSVVTHKMKANANTRMIQFIKEENEDRVNRFYYTFRNNFYIRKKKSVRATIMYMAKLVSVLIALVFIGKKYKLKKMKTLIKGFMHGITFNPKIEYVER